MEQTERELLLRRLVDWRAEAGILSVYVHIDPGDRGRGWRIELKDHLRDLADDKASHAERRAFEAAVHEVLEERFPEQGPPPEGRGHVGFIELAERQPTAVWRNMQMGPPRTEAARYHRPYIRPLVELFSDGPHVGVVLASADRVRLLDWSLGAIRELEDWELTLFSLDWRERKAERSLPGRGTTPSASGRDQFAQRLDANRQRFLREVGSLVGKEQPERRWSYLIVFGVEDYPRELADGLGSVSVPIHTVRHDLISAPESQVAERVEAEVRELDTHHEQEVVHEIEEAIGADPGTSLGPQETLQAVAEGRVRHLVFDAELERDGRLLEASLAYEDGGEDGLPVIERMVELAISTDALVTPVHDEPASKLERHEGVAALLRY